MTRKEMIRSNAFAGKCFLSDPFVPLTCDGIADPFRPAVPQSYSGLLLSDEEDIVQPKQISRFRFRIRLEGLSGQSVVALLQFEDSQLRMQPI